MSRKSTTWGWNAFDYWCAEERERMFEDPIKYKPRCGWSRKKKKLRHAKTCACHPVNQ